MTGRKAGGKRDRIITDFIVGAHAYKQTSRLITCDRGFYRNHFKGLIILDTSSSL